MPGAQPAFLRLEDVVKDFDGTRAVDHVSLEVAQGEIFALLGPSGCGKSTLLRLLAGFETPTAGRIVLGGHDLAGVPPYERPINMMFQSYALFPHLTVWDNIAFGLRREGLPRAEIAQRLEHLLELVQLAPLARRKPHQLSGGQQQRVALARSLARQPQLLLLDEPLGALDRRLREQTQVELVNIVRRVGVTCVLVTHDQDEAMAMAGRIAVMCEGRLLQVGTPDEIYETPASRFVADFIGNVNLMDGRLTVDAHGLLVIDCADGRLDLGPGLHGSAGHAVTVALRPEKVQLSNEPPDRGHGACNQVPGTVEALSYFGSFSLYRLRLASGARLQASVANTQRPHGDAFARGDAVWAHWSRSAPVVLTP